MLLNSPLGRVAIDMRDRVFPGVSLLYVSADCSAPPKLDVDQANSLARQSAGVKDGVKCRRFGGRFRTFAITASQTGSARS